MWFKIRSSARDESGDARRLSSIEQSISNAIADAETEKKGLARRLEGARARASVLLGNDVAEYQDRDPKSEQLLQQAEQDMIAGQKRINQLATHIDHMGRVLDFLKQK
jgi:hypothetical protein